MLKKNTELTLNIEAIGSNGEGIARHDKYVIFIPFTITGEKVKARILKVKNNIAFAKVLEIYTPADQRVRPKCTVYEKCGGCQLQHIKYAVQLKLKSKTVRDCFQKIAGIDMEIPAASPSNCVYKYRNKLQLPVGAGADGGLTVGFFAPNSHRIVSIEECPIHPDWAADAISALKDYAQKYGITGYDDITKQGIIRHLVIREIGGKFIIGLVVTKQPAGIDYFIEKLSEKFKSLSFFLNFNDADTNVVFGWEFKHLFGPERFEEDSGGIKYFVGAETFLQINPYIMRKLYDKVIKCCEGGTVVDAYSGSGLLSAMIARRSEKVYGIEIVKEAVECADMLAKNNGLSDKMVNIHGKVEDKLEEVLKRAGDVTLVLDPPRKGCEPSVINSVLKARPKKIVYISCNPATLARDVGLLCGTLKYDGKQLVKQSSCQNRQDDDSCAYEIEFIEPYDMFPQTKHIETLVCLNKKR